jgi:hypothetical protein
MQFQGEETVFRKILASAIRTVRAGVRKLIWWTWFTRSGLWKNRSEKVMIVDFW